MSTATRPGAEGSGALLASQRQDSWDLYVRLGALAIVAVQIVRAFLYPFLAGATDLGPDGSTYLHYGSVIATQGFPWPAIDQWISAHLYVLSLADLSRLTGPSVLAVRLINLGLWLAMLRLSLGLYRTFLSPTLATVAIATLALDDPFHFIKYAQYELLLLVLVLAATKVFLDTADAHTDAAPGSAPDPGCSTGPEAGPGHPVDPDARGPSAAGMDGGGKTRPTALTPCWALFLSGVGFGLAGLTQGKALPIAPVVWAGWALVVVLGSRSNGGSNPVGAAMVRCIRTGIPVALGLAVVVGFWAYRNFVVTGRVLLTSSNGGMTFYLGNNPYANGTLTYPPDDRWPVDHSLPMEAQDPGLYKAGWDYALAHPGRELFVLVPLKMYYLYELWRPRNVLLMVLFVAGVVVAWRRGLTPEHGALLALVAYIAILHAIFYGWGRHRFPALPAMHAFAAIALGALASRLAPRNRPGPGDSAR